MREIKFRAYIKPYGENGESGQFGCEIFEVNEIYFDQKLVYGNRYRNKPFTFDDIELMQYTEFKDINGKEIYEGDIVEFCDENFQIVIRDGMFLRVPINKNESPISLHERFPYDKVRGNIYQNPELLIE